MRDIRFRGFHPNENGKEKVFVNGERINGFWFYGYYAVINSPFTVDGNQRKHIICNGTNVFNFKVIPETIGQYTGLTDKNGTRIFEGDICKNIKTGKIVSVCWHGTFAGFCWHKKKENNKYLYDFGELFRVSDYYEVIGNIFENPEFESEVNK